MEAAGRGAAEAIEAQRLDAVESDASAARSQSGFGPSQESGAQMIEHRLTKVEDVHIEVESAGGGDRQPVEMGGAEEVGTRPVGEPAGRTAEGGSRFEQPGINVRRRGFPEQHAERSAQGVGAFSLRKVHGVDGPEMEPEAEKVE